MLTTDTAKGVTMDSLKSLSSHVLKVYPFDSEFIASFDYKDDKPSTSGLETVIILDRSGSMGRSVQKIMKCVLPQFFNNLHYDPKTVISIIAFECKTTLHKIMIGDLKRNTMKSAGGTNMAGAVENLERLFKSFQARSLNFLRILTISDGEVFENPKYLRKAQSKLKYVQRKYSKNKGKRTKKCLALLHEKVVNKRKDFLHKVSIRLIRENQTIALETLAVKNMVKKLGDNWVS